MSYAESLAKHMFEATLTSWGVKETLKTMIANCGADDLQLKKDLETALKNYESKDLEYATE